MATHTPIPINEQKEVEEKEKIECFDCGKISKLFETREATSYGGYTFYYNLGECCKDNYIEEDVCEICGGENEKEASCRVSEYDSYTLCDDCIPPDDICSVKEWNERWTKKGMDTFDFEKMKWKE